MAGNTILNTTFVVHDSIEADFLRWLRDVYVPPAMASGAFESVRVARVLTRVEPDTSSIAVQFAALSPELCNRWHEGEASALHADLHSRWADRLLHFTTFMEAINLDSI